MKALKIFVGLAVALAGLYLVFIEVSMAIGESHAFHGANVAVFWAVVAFGLLLACVGGFLAVYAARS